jgi:hydroxymethylglutaryl-CoA synthase
MTITAESETLREPSAPIMRPARKTGIVGYGSYVPRYRLPGKEISRVWTEGNTPPIVPEKSVPGLDEDVITMSIEAARNALARAGVDPQKIGAVWVGSESHPYAVKPTSSVVGEAIGATPHLLAADWEFACKAGSEAMQAAIGMVGSGMIQYALAIGMDAAQARPGDALEYTAGAGGGAFLIGPAEEALALIDASYSYATDTPDFWRRDNAEYPSHGQRFTVEPAYFRHVIGAGRALLEATGTKAGDYRFAVFHQPNPKFPQRAAAMLGFSPEQIRAGMLAPQIGNTYAGSALIGLTAVLDEAAPGDRILMISFGSGAGSDAFQITATEKLPPRRALAPSTGAYVARRKEIDYGVYVRYRGKLKM